MEGHGIRMMGKVFGGMINIVIGVLVILLVKEAQPMQLIWKMMEDVFQKYLIKNGIGAMALIGMKLEIKLKSDVAINQKVSFRYN